MISTLLSCVLQLLKANELNLALIAAIPAFLVRRRVWDPCHAARSMWCFLGT